MNTVAIEKKQETAQRYAEYFNTLSPESVLQIHDLIADDIHFIDPFNDVHGRDKVERLVTKMFEDVQNPRFKILDLAWSGDMCLMRWDFSCEQKLLGNWSVRGITELQFNDEGRVVAHYDYWDASRYFYKKIPVIGFLIGMIQKRASI
ncbi:nuclear transport factor 2 family protein [Rhodobacteraceae bacterium RKSG542]|uniref:nuclear transport factor 2 family protein n=1 Tax=Pseudovibrio flavus TaxID=2529854 RepID=UPI0012BCECEC|nr:nuclear transport factor 2 family protein [Pseudovibrio flavus]MTI16294.1 nuclear transport factor 2 family protein [Pseudovibrio flavus]